MKTLMLKLLVDDDGLFDMEYDMDRDDVPALLREIADQMDADCTIDTDRDDHLV